MLLIFRPDHTVGVTAPSLLAARGRDHTALSWAVCSLPAPGGGSPGRRHPSAPRRYPWVPARPHACARGSRDGLAVPSFVPGSATPSARAAALSGSAHQVPPAWCRDGPWHGLRFPSPYPHSAVLVNSELDKIA